jgi:alpha-beta hydrolase superfamily lysophospholipase
MLKQKINISHIPAILWGEKSKHLLIAVHGDQSNKEDDVISELATCAVAKGYQVLSFDLPDHGDRKNENIPCKVQNSVQDLETVMEYAKSLVGNISLFACSMGAYFSLQAYQNEPLQQAYFLTPLVDMERMIQNMMTWFDVSEDRLKEEQEIATPIGKTLYWDYYCYVKAHPITKWQTPTTILCGGEDEVVEKDTVEAFVRRFNATEQIVPKSGHYFHTEKQLSAFSQWCETVISTSQDK